MIFLESDSIAVCVTRYLFGYSTKFHSESRGCSLVPFTCKEDSANSVAHVNSIILWEQYDIVHQLLLFLIYRMLLTCRDLPLLWLLFHRQSNNPDFVTGSLLIVQHLVLLQSRICNCRVGEVGQ
uniref:Nucleic acid binding protein n=1 Tax=Solanum tuberosum TaxID=4113 RepID=M1A349_SOLTU